MRNSFFILVIVLAVSTNSWLPLGAQQVGTCIVASTECLVKQNQVTETPVLLQDGTNKTFSFTSLPASTADIHLFFKGIELIQGQDFTINGQTLSLVKPIDNGLAHLLRISFQSQFAPTGAVSTQNVVVDTSSIVRSVLMRSALLEEYTAPLAATTNLRNEPRSLPVLPTPDVREYRSVNILASRMQAAADPLTRNSNKDRLSRNKDNLQGVEGIGDTLFINNYSGLRGYSNADSILSDGSIRRRGPDHPFRSITMLQERLGSAGTRQ